jgi:hypothetical protein
MLSPREILKYWERSIQSPGDAAQALVRRAQEQGLALVPGQAYVVACLIQCAMAAMDDHNARREQGLSPIDR